MSIYNAIAFLILQLEAINTDFFAIYFVFKKWKFKKEKSEVKKLVKSKNSPLFMESFPSLTITIFPSFCF